MKRSTSHCKKTVHWTTHSKKRKYLKALVSLLSVVVTFGILWYVMFLFLFFFSFFHRGQTTAPGLSPEVMALAARNNGNTTTPRTLLTRENPPPSEEVSKWKTPSQRSVIQSKKHLRFADGTISEPEPAFSLPSGLSRPLVKGTAGSGYGIAEAHEYSAHAENMESREGVLEVEDLEQERNGGDLSSLSSVEEDDFRRGLENLDANIARIQKSLRETALRT